METVDTTDRLAHLVVCVNDRPDSGMPSCGQAHGLEVYRHFQHWIRDRGLATRIWLTKTGCMGWCHVDGATVAFYPEDRWYRAVRPEDCPILVDRHFRPLLEDVDA